MLLAFFLLEEPTYKKRGGKGGGGGKKRKEERKRRWGKGAAVPWSKPSMGDHHHPAVQQSSSQGVKFCLSVGTWVVG